MAKVASEMTESVRREAKEPHVSRYTHIQGFCTLGGKAVPARKLPPVQALLLTCSGAEQFSE